MGTPRSGFRSGGVNDAAFAASSHTHPYTDLEDGTDGELITWDANGNITTVGAGTAAQVLTSNGAGAAPTFQDAAGGADGSLRYAPAYNGTSFPSGSDFGYVTQPEMAADAGTASTQTGTLNADTIYFMPVVPIDRNLYLYDIQSRTSITTTGNHIIGLYSNNPNANEPATLVGSALSNDPIIAAFVTWTPSGSRWQFSAGTLYWLAYLSDTSTTSFYGIRASGTVGFGIAAYSTAPNSRLRYRTLANSYGSGFPASITEGSTTGVVANAATYVPSFVIRYRVDDP